MTSKRNRVGIFTGIIIAVVALGTATFALNPVVPNMRNTSFIDAVPNDNDVRTFDPFKTYTDFYLGRDGTLDDPIIIWGNGAHIQCILVQADYVVIRDFVVHNCDTFGIRANGTGIQIINNTVYDTVKANQLSTGRCNDGAGASWHAAIRPAKSSDVLVAGNTVYESCGEGISALQITGVTIENNVVYDNFSVNIYCDQCSDAIIQNNYSYSTGNPNFLKLGKTARGISIGAELYSGWPFSVHDILIERNTLKNVRGINYISEQSGTPYNVKVKDNAFFPDVPLPLVNLGTWAVVENNIVVTPTLVMPITSTFTTTKTLTPTTVTKTATPITPTASRTLTAVPTLTATRAPTSTSTPTRLPTSTATKSPTPMPTAMCLPLVFPDYTVWVCDRQPAQR